VCAANANTPDCVRVIFHRGAKVADGGSGGPAIEDPAGLLEWLAPDRCAATFHDVKEVEERQSALQDIVRRWIAQV
jgi:hypothetical protein